MSMENRGRRRERSPGAAGGGRPPSRGRRAGWMILLAVAALLAGAPCPVRAVPAGPPPAGEEGSGAGHRVNVNTAGIEELRALPRIGPALARRIVEYRRKAGPFQRVEDLLAVRGIGPKLLARLRDRITVGARDPGRDGRDAP